MSFDAHLQPPEPDAERAMEVYCGADDVEQIPLTDTLRKALDAMVNEWGEPERNARLVESVSFEYGRATAASKVTYDCDFEGTVDVMVDSLGWQRWRCPDCGTEHETEPDDGFDG